MKNKLNTKILLVLILILGLVVRIYQLDSIPPSISWDEAAVGYNAWTIGEYGKDEYGQTFPLSFKSFGDDKHPIHIYLTAISIKLLGLNEFSTRIPSAIIGTLNILLIYFLAKILFKKEIISLAAAAFLAISPYSIHFSRFNHEANFCLFFYLLGLILFYLSFKKNKILLPVSLLSFIISFLTYHSAKLIVPVTFFLLLGFYFKEIIKNKVGIVFCGVLLSVFTLILTNNPSLLGLARINQTTLNKKTIENTPLYKLTHNENLGRINLIAAQYIWHFTPQFLFITGDKNPRLSAQKGQFYWLDLPFFLLGTFYLIRKRFKEGLLVLGWFILAPLPSSVVAEAPHAARALFLMGSWQLISAVGFYYLISLVRKRILAWGIILVSIVIFSFSLLIFLKYYFGEYNQRYAIEWQYGMKQIVEYVKQHNEYDQVSMTEVRSQPYIFFLYYLKTPLPEFKNTVIYNNSENKSSNSVSNFDRYYFGGWNKVESLPEKGILYILTPSEYGGLKHKQEFKVKKLIKYPNSTDAFYIVSVD